ncbi:Slp family lipoprotein [Kangiella sp.]|uniref:Slp family lipoprotein n=1 Tax=Kangiella sp. TaxID=1920245 RepID=UPI00198D4117|nr:Slp family lipoprotein [Kangiella sp.]MBD3653605.1 Slp family lipoprotein [Kangiella sp.]
MRHYLRLFSVGALAGLLAACANVPESIEFEEANRVDFAQVAQSPASYTGQEVRWGGIIARVENLEKDTLIEVVNLPLDRQARPVKDSQTGGRFIARVPGFLDPMIYQKGKEITLVGMLAEPMPGKVGKHEINFPVVDIRNHYLWKERPKREYVEVYSVWDPYWFYHRPYYWPYYYRYPVIRQYEPRIDPNLDKQPNDPPMPKQKVKPSNPEPKARIQPTTSPRPASKPRVSPKLGDGFIKQK